MTKCRRNISSYINDHKINTCIQFCGKKHPQSNINANLNSQKKSKRHVISQYFSTPNLRLIIATSVICLLFSLSGHLSPVNGKLTRKTYTVWDLSPQELDNLLKQEKALQKGKRAVDIFFRRRAKKTKELLPINEYESINGAPSEVSNNLGCLFSNEVCNENEICFDDLILGRCVSDDSEIDAEEGLQPLSTDDQSVLDNEVEQLLEQGFRWDDPYFQCVIQTLIGSFRYYGLEYDTTLCKAAFLPELSIERRVDVPKKFILSDSDIDNTNSKNLNIEEDDDNVENPENDEEIDENQADLTSNKYEKRSNDKSKRDHHNTIFVETPQSFNVQNDPIQIDQPSFYETQLASEDQDNNELGGIDIEGPPTLAYPSMNYLVRQEEDGGILIEPDHISSITSDDAKQYQQPESQGDELNYVIPSYQIQQPTVELDFPTTHESSSSLQIPFHPQEEQQLADLIWMDDNIRDQNVQEQPNELSYHPVIWVDDDASFNNNDEHLDIDPDSLLINYQLPEEGGSSGGIDISEDLLPVFQKKKRGMISENENSYNDGSNDEQEILYLPVYDDADTELLSRHKFSGLSKRSEPKVETKEHEETYEYPVMVSLDGKEVPSIHYTVHDEEEPSGLKEDVDLYEPTLMEDKDTSGIYGDSGDGKDDELNYALENLADVEENEQENGNENALGSFTFNRKERLDVKKPGPFFPNSENNFFIKKLLESDDEKKEEKRPDDSNTQKDQGVVLGDPFGPRRSNYEKDGKGQIEYEMPLQVLNPDPKKRFLASNYKEEEQQQPKKFLHLMMKKRFDTFQEGMNLVDIIAEELGLPRHALDEERIDDHHVQFRVDPNPQNINAEKMANSLENDIVLRKRISNELGLEVDKAAAGDRDDYDVFKFPASSINNMLYAILIATSTLALLILSTAIIVLTKHCVRRRRETKAMNKLRNQDNLEAERGKVQEEYKQLCRDWSKKNTTNSVQPDNNSKSSLESNSSKTSTNQPTSAAIKKLQGQDSKESNRSSTSSWSEEPTSTNMDISTGHMVLAYMEDHLKNKQRLEQEWVALCGYEAEPCATTIAFKTENKKKNRYPDKLPYDHNRVILNAVLNGSNSDYINASSVTDHDPRNPSYIVTQGPLAQTVADFWQMIWEQGCVVIVMLSRLQDNGYQLCHRYWPEEGSEQYHIFEVHLVSEHVWCDDYLVRSVYLKNTRTGETRTVTQFHFRSWPAQSVPSSTKALLEFRRKVNKSYRGRSAPICVHCSDGVGRSGTYVLIDMVLNRMAKGCKEIDIAATLEHIRDQRSGMVQTRPQFEFCLMAVAEEVHAILKALLP